MRAARGARPNWLDTGLAAVGVVLGAGFVAYLMTGASGYWRPSVTIPIGITLIAIAGFDHLRLAARAWRARHFALEHGVKVIFVVSALASAGLGALAPGWQPWSQIGPSVVVTIFAIAYVVARGKAGRSPAASVDHSESASK